MVASALCLGLFQSMDWAEDALSALCRRSSSVVDPAHSWISCDPSACESGFWTWSCSMWRSPESFPRCLETMWHSHLDELRDCGHRSGRWCFARAIDILGNTRLSVCAVVGSPHNAMVHWSSLLQRSWQGKLRLWNDDSSTP